jgi:putative transposase
VTLPKPRVPGTTYFISAVCERRECRLPPTEETAGAIAVVLVDALERHGLTLTAISVPNNHVHMVVYDPRGAVSEFLRDVKSLVARFGNTRDGVKGWGFWDRQQSVCMALGDVQSVVDKVAYTVANPVTSFLVARGEAWPGLQTRVEDLGSWRGRVYVRPETFFAEDGWASQSVEVVSELPPMVTRVMGAEAFRRRVGDAVERLESAAREEAAAKGRGFVGVAKVLARGVWHRPRSPSKRKAGREAEALKQVAASSRKRLGVMVEALADFRRAHREAWEALRRGVSVLFPAGAYKAWRWYGASRSTASVPWAVPSG